MRKQFIVAIAIIVTLAMLMPVASDEENCTQTKAINETMMKSQKYIRYMIEGGSPSIEELSSALGYSVIGQSKGSQVQLKNITDCVYSDITGDSINDVIVVTDITGPITNMSSGVVAVNGSDGTRLWSKSFKNCTAIVGPTTDLNGDNKNDVFIFTLSIYPEKYQNKIIAVNGWNGKELWSKYLEIKSLEFPKALIIDPTNLTSPNTTDLLISIIKVHLLFRTVTSEITALNGSNGEELWSKSFRDSTAVARPVDLTNDGKDEVVITNIRTFMSSDVIVVNGTCGTEVWRKYYRDVIIGYSAGDLTGDGANDLAVQIGCCKLEALRGYDGKWLWTIRV